MTVCAALKTLTLHAFFVRWPLQLVDEVLLRRLILLYHDNLLQALFLILYNKVRTLIPFHVDWQKVWSGEDICFPRALDVLVSEFLGWSVAEHYFAQRGHQLRLADNDEALVHAMQQLFVFLVGERDLIVQLGHVVDT